MTNIYKVILAVSEWAFKVVKSFLPNVGIPAESAVGKFMYGILGVNPATYNVWNELGFLAEPMIQTVVTPMIGKYMSGIPDEQVKDIAMKFADAFIKQAQEKGSINVFGVEIGQNAFVDLKNILSKKFEEYGESY